MSTTLTVNYPVNGNSSGTINAFIPQLPAMGPGPLPNQLTAKVYADALYFLGQSDGNVNVYDGYKHFVFVLVGSTLSYIDNSGAIPSSVAFQVTPLGGMPTAMAVTADNTTLYLVGNGHLFRSTITNVKATGFVGQAAPAAILGIPATTISIAIRP